MSNETITLYYSPQTRATGARILLEELGRPYELHVLNMKAGEQRQPAYLAINPLGKVPAIRHRGQLVSEQGGVYLYLADLIPEAGLAPGINEPDRATYVRWMFMYGSCFEPAIADRYAKHPQASLNETVYASYDLLFDTLGLALTPGPYLLGARFSAVDLLWGTALRWAMMFGMVEARPVFSDYVERIASRDSVQRVEAWDAAMVAEHEAAVKSAGGVAA